MRHKINQNKKAFKNACVNTHTDEDYYDLIPSESFKKIKFTYCKECSKVYPERRLCEKCYPIFTLDSQKLETANNMIEKNTEQSISNSRYKTPTNKTEYWEVLYSNWDSIYLLLKVFLSTEHNKWIDGSNLDEKLGDYLVKLKDSKNPRLIRAFNAAYYNAPDTVNSYTHPGWAILYDLCTKEKVIYNS